MTFFPLERLHRLHDGYMQAFTVDGQPLLLVHTDGRTHLIANRCPHMNAPLTHASIEGDIIRCPLHRFEYRLSSGLPAREVFEAGGGRLQRYSLAYEGNQVGVYL
ncbi:Rieske (2Fe-2S) protein [Proteobacteria bacterium 005FR1]|nr:Rieske (2Fe-2S) protein [Proteobacteria bacterium 005FR1]